MDSGRAAFDKSRHRAWNQSSELRAQTHLASICSINRGGVSKDNSALFKQRRRENVNSGIPRLARSRSWFEYLAPIR
jgi:hypothetical protein